MIQKTLVNFRAIVINLLGDSCEYCGKTKRLYVHHTLPTTRGGKDEYANLQLVCTTCHKGIHRQWNKVWPLKQIAILFCSKCGIKLVRKKKTKKPLCPLCRARRTKIYNKEYNQKKKLKKL